MIRFWHVGFAVFAVSASSQALAQDQGATQSRPEIYQQIVACRSIADNDERLKCFDSSSEKFVAAVDDKSLVVLDKAEVQKTRRSLFGFTLPSLKLFGGGDKSDEADEFKQIDGVIAAATPLPYGRWSVTLEEGGTWEQIDTRNLVMRPRPGQSITIKKAALTSFMASINGQPSIRFKRVE